jgi:CAAX protease family protein
VQRKHQREMDKLLGLAVERSASVNLFEIVSEVLVGSEVRRSFRQVWHGSRLSLRQLQAGVRLRRMWAVAFFALTYGVTALLWLPAIRSGQPLSVLLQGREALPLVVATIVPSLVAIFLSGLEGHWRGIRGLLSQAVRWRFGVGWYALAIFLPPAVWAVSLALGRILGAGAPVVQLDVLIPLAAIGEELGWRGYALPRLQLHMRPLPASLLIGVLWAGWHLPYYAFPDAHPLPFAIDFALFSAAIISESVLATWIYNSTGSSVLATMLYHHSIHVASIIPVIPGMFGATILALVNVVAAIGAVFASRGSLVGVRRTRLADRNLRPLSA